MTIPKYFKGKDLRAELTSHIVGDFRLWTFTPGYKNWEFKELKLNDLLETELKNKALFIDVEDNKNVFKLVNNSWEFEKTLEISTESSQDTEIIDECIELQTPSHAKAIVVYKWYDWNNGDPKLTLFKLVTLTSTANMSQIRKDLYEHRMPSSENLSKMVLHLEKCKITDTKNKEQICNIHTYKLEDNYELTISKRGTFGVRHVIIDNGDAFIGEIPLENPDYIDAKKYITSICNGIQVQIIHYDKYQNFAFTSYARSVLNSMNIDSGLMISTKLSNTQAQLMADIALNFPYNHQITLNQIQIFTMKTNSAIPVLLPYPEEENKFKKNLTVTTVASIIETSNILYFDISPYPVQALTNKLLVYVWLLDSNFRKISQIHKLIKQSGCVGDLDSELRLDFQEKIEKNTEFSYFLLNHPQFAIVKELEFQQALSFYATNKNYIVCARPNEEINSDKVSSK